MGDFIAFSEEIDAGMEFLEHHQILGAKWGVMNGPPYPLGRGDHSSSEKSAAKKAGIKVGGSSGKGSIENVEKKKSPAQNKPKKPKKPLTPEEKREKALEAARSGDAKKIAKNMDQLSTEELRDATDRARYKNQLTSEDPKASKEEMAKLEAIRSGDKEKVKQYADKMSYNELVEAMNKVDLTQRLNYEPPPPSAMDKLKNVANKVDDFRQVAEKGINAYNVAASIYNSTHKGGAQWPIIEKKVNDNKSKEQQITQNLINQAMNDVNKNMHQAQQQNQQKSYKDQSDEALRNAKIDYKNQQKFEKWKDKQESKASAKEKQKAEEQDKKTTQELNEKLNEKREEAQVNNSKSNTNKSETTSNQQSPTNQYTPERAPQFKRSFFNTKKPEGSTEGQTKSTNQEPTEEQKRLVEEARKSDERYLNQMNNMSKQEVKNNYNNVKDTPISSYDKQYQKEINESFDDIMSDYNESVRRQQVTAQERQDRAQTVQDAKKYYRDAMYEGNKEASRYWYEVIRNNE